MPEVEEAVVEIPTPGPGGPTTAAVVVVGGGAEPEGGISSLSEAMLENQSETPHYNLLLKKETISQYFFTSK